MIKLKSEKYVRKLETALFQGGNVICEGLTEELDPALTPLVFREVQEIKGERYIKFNDNHMEFNPEKFHMYLFTIMANPHFSPEVHARTTILNFSVTHEALEQ